MKNIRTKLSVAVIAVFGLALTSCNTTIEVAKKRHSRGYYVSISNGKTVEKKASKVSEQPAQVKEFAQFIEKQNNSVATVVPSKVEAVQKAEVLKETVTVAKEEVKTEKKSAISTFKALKEIKKAVKESKSATSSVEDSSDETDQLLLLILAILLPPLAVYLVKDIGTEFWISLLLTLLLFWVPGVIYAILVVLGKI